MNKKKVISFSILGVAIVLVGTLLAFYLSHLADFNALGSIVRIDNRERGFVMEYQGDYYLSAFIARGGAQNDAELTEFVKDSIFGGVLSGFIKTQLPEDPFQGKSFYNQTADSPDACTTFTATLQNGDHIFARNFDNALGNYLLLKTTPPEGSGRYRSMTTVNLKYLSNSKFGYHANPSGLIEKITMLASPYAPMDGLNEKGLAIAVNVLSIDSNRVNKDTAKPDLNTSGVLRMVLEYCATVDEAVALIDGFDVHDSIGSAYHFQIADGSGDSAVIEWLSSEYGMENIAMKVIRQNRVTFVHEDGSFYSPLKDKPFLINTNHSLIEDERPEADIKEKDGNIADARIGNSTRARYNRTLDTLLEHNGLLRDESQALEVLSAASYVESDPGKTNTYWSVVYNLDTLSAVFVPFTSYEQSPIRISLYDE
ncbi:MAG: carcinine hydrolase/isopenicillin-N N-acyltransferase family protein [Clostridiales bacterium]|nr:carcinine hydrolase/isopenicillin-N N-acyltransferase family protein [Clostridiales bacterium]